MDEEQDVLESDTEQTTEVKDPSDNLTPEHPRFKQVIAENHELKQSIEEMKSQMADLKSSIQDKQDTGEDTDQEELALRKIERRMSEKFASREDLKAEREAITFDKLSGRYDGSNGYPKFVPVDVVAYAKRNGYGANYEAAYKDMHFDAIVSTKRGETLRPPTSEKPTGGEKQGETDTIALEDIANMSDQEYEKNRDKILQAARPK